MTKSNFALRLQPSLLEELRGVAEVEDSTLYQFIKIAAAEKLAALPIEAYFRECAARRIFRSAEGSRSTGNQ